MNTVQIILTCPNCGHSIWEATDNHEFKCIKCEEIVYTENMCSSTKDTDETDWFGQVRWCEEDLKNALEVQGYPVTENNVAKLYSLCTHHFFTDCMIERGWEYIYDQIGGDGWDEYDDDEDYIRHCNCCNAPLSNGFMVEGGWWYCCEDCFNSVMDKDYGQGKWRATEKEGECGGFYEYLDDDREWKDTGIFWTQWD